MARPTTIDPRTITIRRAISLEAHAGAQSADDRGVHVLELAARRQRLLEPRIDDLQIDRQAEPHDHRTSSGVVPVFRPTCSRRTRRTSSMVWGLPCVEWLDGRTISSDSTGSMCALEDPTPPVVPCSPGPSVSPG